MNSFLKRIYLLKHVLQKKKKQVGTLLYYVMHCNRIVEKTGTTIESL